MTSSVTSSFSRKLQCSAGSNQQLRRCARYGISCDDISSDVITISRKLSADEKNWMSTAELNSNGENDKKPAKEKDASTVPLSVLYRTLLNGKNFVSNGKKFYRGLYKKAAPLKKIDEWTKRLRNCEAEAVRGFVAQKRKSIEDNNRGKMNLK
ncbi:hypothetical protein F511_43564 [Dorcoceras hygrometricum]|uniref:Uncharacterized protein n=1 Tax=Dorcoceras hygrometricum TaxID=472368 RepID=A0A2Z7AK46_9LAMI|nr:hypothetical protein F511_43564 [Dorcoceras hygrometricum]